MPRTTLKDRIVGRIVHGSKAQSLIYPMKNGNTRGEVLKIIEAAMQTKGREGKVVQGWWVRFNL